MANPSRMDQRIALKRVGQSYASDGSVVATLTTLAECWARVDITGGAEGEQESQTVAVNSATFEVRHSPSLASLTSRDLVEWNSRMWAVTATVQIPAGRPDVIRITGQSRADTLLAS